MPSDEPATATRRAPLAPQRTSPARPTLGRILRALRTPAANERPAGVPKLRYRFPPQWIYAMGRDVIFDKPRSFRADCALAVRSLPLPPLLDGLEHIPASGSFILVANHYQRRDLWIGWPGGLICDTLWCARTDLVCHWVVTDRAVLDGATVRGTPALFARVARVWDMLLVTPPDARDADAEHARRHALRRCLRALDRSDGRPVCLCIFPEGIAGSTTGLARATPGSGRSLLALAATGAPLLPAAVWEEPGGALHLRFGAPWQPIPPAGMARRDLDAWAGDDALQRVAALLPPAQRGVYA